MKVFNSFSLSFADPSQERAYRRARGKWNAGALGLLAVAAVGVLLQEGTWVSMQAGGVALVCFLTLKTNPYLSLLLFTYLHHLVLLYFKSVTQVSVLFSALQVLPGTYCYTGMAVPRVVASIGSLYFLLSPDWTSSVPLPSVLLLVSFLLSSFLLLHLESTQRLRFLYKDYDHSWESVYHTIVTGISVPLVVLRANEVVYSNEAAGKLLNASNPVEISRKLTSFQLGSPEGNGSYGRNQPLWSEVNACLKRKQGNVVMRKYAVEAGGAAGRVALVPVGKVIQWESGVPALLLTLSQQGSPASIPPLDPSPHFLSDLRQQLNEIHANSKVLRAVHSEAAFEELERSILSQYYQVYTAMVSSIQDLATLAAGKVLKLSPQSISLDEEIQKIIDFFNPTARSKAVSLQVNTSPSLSPRISIDLIRMKQLLFPTLKAAIDNSRGSEIVLVDLSDMKTAEKRELQVKITYKPIDNPSEASLVPILGLFRAVSSTGFQSSKGVFSFTVLCGDVKIKGSMQTDEDLHVSSDEEHQSMVPAGIRNRGKT